ncbi:flavin reductase family protein [Tenacibaculum sp. UWU-22]|uniref:flavin reductase family protein n=1 Tax=Tenacibaculum sp. UWU-22 TaxID=3234187 RepID=UPI0034DB6C59
MYSLDPKEISEKKTYGYLTSAIAPRPIALASTVDENGNPNLAPFSFFNVFSANPPILILSPVLNVDGSQKHTLENAIATKEIVINVVDYNITQKTSDASFSFEKGVSEFDEVGFTKLASDIVKPFRVKESPVHFECKVKEVVHLGYGSIAGNLIICEVIKMHFSETVLDDKSRIDQTKIDLVARAGGDYYTRMKDGFFKVERPK